MKCNNLDNGCQWTGELRELETHLQSCDYALLPCTNECENNDQIVKVLRKDLQDHLTNDCPRRQHQCVHCHEMGEHQDITSLSLHLETCPKFFVKCPNENRGCPSQVLRHEVSTHQSTCDYEPVPCKYAEVGCEVKPLRKSLQEHEEDSQLHLRVTTETVLKLRKELSALTNKPQLVFRFLNFKKCKNESCFFRSPSFYTSPSGYKLCIYVHAKGHGVGENSHVSVFSVLMKGDNDDYLVWPFTGTITMQLLNQLEDKNHHEESCTFPEDNERNKRVLDDELESERINGWGSAMFLSHDDLKFQPAKNCQYLRDDSLTFRISVKVPGHKPWLECV